MFRSRSSDTQTLGASYLRNQIFGSGSPTSTIPIKTNSSTHKEKQNFDDTPPLGSNHCDPVLKKSFVIISSFSFPISRMTSQMFQVAVLTFLFSTILISVEASTQMHDHIHTDENGTQFVNRMEKRNSNVHKGKVVISIKVT